jgi:DNA-binding NarL/FixJ family response regulator
MLAPARHIGGTETEAFIQEPGSPVRVKAPNPGAHGRPVPSPRVRNAPAKAARHPRVPLSPASPRPPAAAETAAWKEKLLTRRYHFPPAGDTDKDWAVKIDHAGLGYWFPLRTEDRDLAAAKARRIFETVRDHGWETGCRRFSRELILNFEWCANPLLCTYITIHTLLKNPPAAATAAAIPPAPETGRVIILETDAGIRHALQWCINQQAGLEAVPCDSTAHFLELNHACQPAVVLLNRNLAERVGMDLSAGLTVLRPGVVALSYSVSVDGDQMFASAPGGAEGYLFKRVKPASVFDPVLNVLRLASSGAGDFFDAIRAYFKELLRPRTEAGSQALARLTPRENDVLALLSKGCVDKEIAQALGISVWTVHGHIKKIFERLHVRTRTEAVVRYLEK